MSGGPLEAAIIFPDSTNVPAGAPRRHKPAHRDAEPALKQEWMKSVSSNPKTETSPTDWWHTEITDMAPGQLRLRGRPIEDLIGNVTFAQMVWLMLRGEVPGEKQAALLEAALVSAVDHGPQAPSIAVARMAVSCGVALNGAMASALNMLDDVHGGAGEQAAELYVRVENRLGSAEELKDAVAAELDDFTPEKRGKFVPGFGHRFHKPTDPRTPRLLALADEAAASSVIPGTTVEIARAIEAELARRKGTALAMNVDGATAAIYVELGFAPPLARGLFCISRSVGLLAHAWEQMNQGARNKGPTPPQYRWRYDGPNPIS